MTSSYRILFEVDLMHDYYKNGLCSDFNIIPSPETALLIRNQQLVFKNTGNRIVVLTRLKKDDLPAEDGKPLVNISPDTKFVFYLSLNKPEFTSFTNINLDALKSRRLYFTNLNQNKYKGQAQLTNPIDNYDNAKPYQPGDLADDGTKKIFECIKASTGNNTANATFWTSRSDIPYVSTKDFIQPVNTLFNYTAPAKTDLFNVNVFGLDTLTNQYTVNLSSQTFSFNEPVKNIQLDLPGLKITKGKYRITINSDELVVYADNEFIYGGYTGLVEIFSHFPNGNDFAFLDAGGKPIEKKYSLLFANRLATWKYITSKHKVTGISHPTNKYTFAATPVLPAAPDYYVSNIPVPLTQFPEEFRLQLSPQVSSGPPRAPGPDLAVPGVISRLQPGNDFYCTIYLNF